MVKYIIEVHKGTTSELPKHREDKKKILLIQNFPLTTNRLQYIKINIINKGLNT